MSVRRIPLLAALALSTLLGGSAAEARPAKAPKSSKQTLLSLDPNGPRLDLISGRLSIVMPTGTRNPAEEPQFDESVLWVEAGKEKLVLVASELAVVSGGDLSKDAETLLKKMGGEASMTQEKLVLAPGLQGLALLPAHPSSGQELNLAMAVLAAREDQSLLLLRFFVTPQSPKKMTLLTQRLRTIVPSLQPGPRRLDTAAGPRTLAPDRLTIDLPEGFVLSTQIVEELHLHQLRRLDEIGKDMEGCEIYVGPLPSPFSRAEDDSEPPVPFRAKLLGAETDWQRRTTPVGTLEESTIPNPEQNDTSIHVVCIASPERLPLLHTMVETLRPVAPVAAPVAPTAVPGT